MRPSCDTCIRRHKASFPNSRIAPRRHTHQDDRLNQAYKAMRFRLGTLDRRTAVEAQRAWIDFRDKDCAAHAGRFGPDAGPTTLSTCTMKSTASRAQQLERWLGSIERRD